MRLLLLPGLLSASSAAASSQFPIHSSPEISSASDFTVFQSQTSPSHSIRIKPQNSTLCNTTVPQYTGWLDVGTSHLFFWYFAAENPSSDETASPLALWINGGPGASSMLGLFQELGPCLINEHGNGTVYNPYGWNKDTALIFLDQPAGVGFSYVDDGEPLPADSFTAAADMQKFLQMFMSQVFPKHVKGPLVITGESYAGHYLPSLGAQIIRQNLLHPKQPQVPLKSLMIGNGYVSPLDTAYGYWETLCTTNPGVKKPVFNETRCDIIAANVPRCLDVAKTCYERPDPAICNAASKVCEDGVISFYEGESYPGGRNPYDISVPCLVNDGCYPASPHIERYLNLPHIFSSLSPPHSLKNFSLSSEPTFLAFLANGDQSINMKAELTYLLASQIDVLIYQGNFDLVCNTAGAKRWTAGLVWKGQTAFTAKELKSWKGGDGAMAGSFKEVNIKMVEGDEKTTRFALLTIDGAGHLVPQDKPEASLDMLTRWLAGKAFD